MSNVTSISVFSKLEKLKRSKVKPFTAAISNINMAFSPLGMSDDMAMRLMIADQVKMTKEFAILFHKHTISHKISFDDFCNNVCFLDRRLFIYHIIRSTYSTIKTDEIKCPNCGTVEQHTVPIDSIINEFETWNEDTSFLDYTLDVVFPINEEEIKNIILHLSPPTFKNQLSLLDHLGEKTIKENLKNLNNIFSRTEDLLSITKKISIEMEDDIIETIQNLEDLKLCIRDYLSLDIVSSGIEKFNDKFNKFIPDFTANFKCSNCSTPNSTDISIEMELFKSFFK